MKRQDWFRHVEAQRGSGMTVKAYCEEQALEASSFYRYRRMLAAESSPVFVPVSVSKERQVSELSLHLRVTGKNEVEFNGRTTNVNLLRSLLGPGR